MYREQRFYMNLCNASTLERDGPPSTTRGIYLFTLCAPPITSHFMQCILSVRLSVRFVPSVEHGVSDDRSYTAPHVGEVIRAFLTLTRPTSSSDVGGSVSYTHLTLPTIYSV